MTRLVRHSLVPLLLGVPFVVLGCGGSGKPVVAPDAAENNPSVRIDTGVVTVDATADAPAKPQAQTGKLVYRVMMTAPAGVTEAFTADEVALVQTQGIAIQGDTFVFPDVPASGEWVEVGGTRYMADAAGVFEVPAGATSSGTVGVYRQYTDTEPFVSFDLAGSLVDVGQTPVPIPLVVNAAFPMGMDCDGMGSCPDAGMNCTAMGSCPDAASPTGMNCDAGSCAHSLPIPWPGCPQRDISDCASNDGPCCLDFNGPLGDGFAYVRSGPGIDLGMHLSDRQELALEHLLRLVLRRRCGQGHRLPQRGRVPSDRRQRTELLGQPQGAQLPRTRPQCPFGADPSGNLHKRR